MSKNSENELFSQKEAPAGWFHSRTKVVNTFPTIPDPIRTKSYLKIVAFIAKLLKIVDAQLKSLKKIKLVAKAKLHQGRTPELCQIWVFIVYRSVQYWP